MTKMVLKFVLRKKIKNENNLRPEMGSENVCIIFEYTIRTTITHLHLPYDLMK